MNLDPSQLMDKKSTWSMTVCSTLLLRPLSRATATFPAGANQIRLARRPKFGCRRRETFPAAAAAEFGATS